MDVRIAHDIGHNLNDKTKANKTFQTQNAILGTSAKSYMTSHKKSRRNSGAPTKYSYDTPNRQQNYGTPHNYFYNSPREQWNYGTPNYYFYNNAQG